MNNSKLLEKLKKETLKAQNLISTWKLEDVINIWICGRSNLELDFEVTLYDLEYVTNIYTLINEIETIVIKKFNDEEFIKDLKECD